MKIFTPLLLLMALVACRTESGEATGLYTYADSIIRLRAEKDSLFRTEGSPLPGTEAMALFNGLAYFAIDSTYRVTALVQLTPDSMPFSMPTTKSHDNQYRQYGWAHFTLAGESCRLALFEPIPATTDAQLFVPFRDATSAITTYGGGRYLDLPFPLSDTLIIDFNMAYNPYCVYNYAYSCPIPPATNTLSVAIEAGEKMIVIPQP